MFFGSLVPIPYCNVAELYLGVRYSLAFAHATVDSNGPVEPPKPEGEDNNNGPRPPTPPVSDLSFGANLTPVSARELMPPSLFLDISDSAPLLHGLAGPIDRRKPFWAGIAEALALTGFDYDTGVRYLTTIATLVRSSPYPLCLPSIFLSEPKVVVTSYSEFVLFVDVTRVAANQYHIKLIRTEKGIEGEDFTGELLYLRKGEY